MVNINGLHLYSLFLELPPRGAALGSGIEAAPAPGAAEDEEDCDDDVGAMSWSDHR